MECYPADLPDIFGELLVRVKICSGENKGHERSGEGKKTLDEKRETGGVRRNRCYG